MRTVSSKARLTLFAGTLALAGMPAIAHAQTVAYARMTVPFAFESNGHAFPAGDYKILTDLNGVMRLEGRYDASVIGIAKDGYSKPHAPGKAIFLPIGNRRLLDQVWMPNTGSHVHCAKTKRERIEEREQLASARLEGVAPVQVALASNPRGSTGR